MFTITYARGGHYCQVTDTPNKNFQRAMINNSALIKLVGSRRYLKIMSKYMHGTGTGNPRGQHVSTGEIFCNFIHLQPYFFI